MRSRTIAWLLGTLALHQLAALPNLPWTFLLLACVALHGLLKPLRLPLWFVAGFLWTGWCAEGVLAARPDPQLVDNDILVRGTVAGVPSVQQRRTRFQFIPQVLFLNDREMALDGFWQLNWYDHAPLLQAGQQWQLRIRLKSPRQFLVPGGFDRQRYLFRNRVTAVGYVRAGASNVLIEPSARAMPLARLRAHLAARVSGSLENTQHRGVIAALMVGVRSKIEAATRDLLQRTGTAHLLAISGLHIAIAASLGFAAGRGGWRLLGPFRQRYPARKVAALGALLTAVAYAALAGFSLPTQRALLMLAAAVLALLVDRGKTPSHVYCWALLATLVWDPLAPLDGGFWLSFGAVAALMLAYKTRIWFPNPTREWVRVQCLLAIALLPLTMKLFAVVNLATLPANLIAVPWAAAAIVPPALLGGLLELLLEGWGEGPWRIAEAAFAALHGYLVWLDRLHLLIPVPLPEAAVLASTAAATLLLLSPRGFPGRWLGLACLPLALLAKPQLPAETLQITVFDTGRGYSTLVQTPERIAVLDAGPRYAADFGFAEAALIPYLKSLGLRRIDALIISRPLASRIGGSRSLLESFPIGRVLVPEPSKAPIQGADTCDAAVLARHADLEVRSERIGTSPSRCRLVVARRTQLLAVLDADGGLHLGAAGSAESWPPYGSSPRTQRGILASYVYALHGGNAELTRTPVAVRIRYWQQR